MPDIKYGTSIRVGNTAGTKPQKPRATRSNVKPPSDPNPTDPVITNLESLVDIQFKPLFSELYERGRGNIEAFASDFLNVSLTNTRTGQRHDGMEKWWHSFPFATERHMSAANRWGKSLSEAVKGLHHGFYQVRDPSYASLTNEYVVLVMSLTIDMARIIYDYALRFALDSKMFAPFVVAEEVKTAPFPILILGTPRHQRSKGFRSEIWARSSSKDARYLLGRKYDFIIYDECARDPHGEKILDEVLRMRLADRNGRIDMISTACGKNWFWTAFNRGLRDIQHTNFYAQSGSSYENPFIDHERVRLNESMMARVWVEQNVHGGFVDALNTFDRTQIEWMYEGVESVRKDGTPTICTNYLDLDRFHASEDGAYLMAIDWALKRDETVIMVADVSKSPSPIVYMQGFSYKDNASRYSWDELKAIAVMVHRRFHNARCLFDSTGLVGPMIMSDLTALGMEHHEGYDFAGNNGVAKDQLVVVTQQALQNKVFQFPMVPTAVNLVDQLLLYDRANDKNQATDFVFSFALLCENLRRANLPISEALDAPFVYASRAYQYGYQVPSRDNYRILGAPEPEAVMDDPFTSENPEMERVLTSTGYKEIAKEELVA